MTEEEKKKSAALVCITGILLMFVGLGVWVFVDDERFLQLGWIGFIIFIIACFVVRFNFRLTEKITNTNDKTLKGSSG